MRWLALSASGFKQAAQDTMILQAFGRASALDDFAHDDERAQTALGLIISGRHFGALKAGEEVFLFGPELRIPMKADTCSNPYRTPFRSCRTVVGAKRRSEGGIKGCPAGVKVLPQFPCSFGAPPRGDDLAINPGASSRRLFGRAVSGGNGLSNSSSRCRRSLRVTDSPARPNRRACV